jgi:hypothetical protein
MVLDIPYMQLSATWYSPQRPADVLKMTHADIYDDALHVRQNKTGKRLAIEITGQLQQVIERLSITPGKTAHLILDEAGKPLTQWSLRYRFDAARAAAGVDFQFRDIRAMTEHYTRSRKGERVKPLR